MLKVTEENYYDLIKTSEVPVLVEFGASWCAPCQEMTRMLEEIEPRYSDRILFTRIDIEECQGVANQLDIRSIPTLVVMQNAEPAAFLVGMQQKIKVDSVLREFT